MAAPTVTRKKYGRAGDLQYGIYLVQFVSDTSGTINTGMRTIFTTSLTNKTLVARGTIMSQKYTGGSTGIVSGFYVSGLVFVSGITAGDVCELMVWGQ